MEQSSEQHQMEVGGVTDPAQIAYPAPTYHATQIMAPGDTPVGGITSPNQPSSSFAASPSLAGQMAYQQAQHFQHQQQQLQVFWANQLQEIERATDFKNHSLPLARIKKIMKADEDVRMISAEAPVVFAKACEMFILELTLRSWIHTEENKRRTLQKNDIAAAITRTDIFDFLVDIVPREDLREEGGLGIPRAAFPGLGAPTESIPYYYLPTQHGSPGMMVGKPMDQNPATLYCTQQPQPLAYMGWPQAQAQAQSQNQHPQDQGQQEPGSTGTTDD